MTTVPASSHGGSAVVPALDYESEAVPATAAGVGYTVSFAAATILSSDVRLKPGDDTTIEWLTAGWYSLTLWVELHAAAGGSGYTDAHMDVSFGGAQSNLSFDTAMDALLGSGNGQVLIGDTELFATADSMQVGVNASGAAAAGNFQGFCSCRIIKLT